jgi:hypothetical protein
MYPRSVSNVIPFLSRALTCFVIRLVKILILYFLLSSKSGLYAVSESRITMVPSFSYLAASIPAVYFFSYCIRLLIIHNKDKYFISLKKRIFAALNIKLFKLSKTWVYNEVVISVVRSSDTV